MPSKISSTKPGKQEASLKIVFFFVFLQLVTRKTFLCLFLRLFVLLGGGARSGVCLLIPVLEFSFNFLSIFIAGLK